MSDYIEGGLGNGVCRDIEEHLRTCRRCRFHVDALNYTIRLFDEWRAEGMPGDAEIRLREKLREETGCFSAPPGERSTRTAGRGKAVRRKASGAGRRKVSGAPRSKVSGASRRRVSGTSPRKAGGRKGRRKKPISKKTTRK
jgi:hypothetical protein